MSVIYNDRHKKKTIIYDWYKRFKNYYESLKDKNRMVDN